MQPMPPVLLPVHAKRHGFTLVELSIVLVIIALLIGGILGGQELMQASRLQAVVKDAQDIRDAFTIFKDKYRDLPGDMMDAKSYWSGCTDLPSNTCNGDGDGQIWGIGPLYKSERVRAWQHLALAGMISGKYTGAITDPYQPGVNAYQSPMDGFFFIVGWHETFGFHNNFILFTGQGNPLRAVDAKFIDQKLDDGIAYKGRVFGTADANTGCPKWDNTSPFDYQVNRSQKECQMRFNWIDSQVDQ